MHGPQHRSCSYPPSPSPVWMTLSIHHPLVPIWHSCYVPPPIIIIIIVTIIITWGAAGSVGVVALQPGSAFTAGSAGLGTAAAAAAAAAAAIAEAAVMPTCPAW